MIRQLPAAIRDFPNFHWLWQKGEGSQWEEDDFCATFSHPLSHPRGTQKIQAHLYLAYLWQYRHVVANGQTICVFLQKLTSESKHGHQLIKWHPAVLDHNFSFAFSALPWYSDLQFCTPHLILILNYSHSRADHQNHRDEVYQATNQSANEVPGQTLKRKEHNLLSHAW